MVAEKEEEEGEGEEEEEEKVLTTENVPTIPEPQVRDDDHTSSFYFRTPRLS